MRRAEGTKTATGDHGPLGYCSSAFLAWASEPKMEERKAFGFGAMIYLLIFSGLLYASYKRIWKNVAH